MSITNFNFFQHIVKWYKSVYTGKKQKEWGSLPWKAVTLFPLEG